MYDVKQAVVGITRQEKIQLYGLYFVFQLIFSSSECAEFLY